MLYAWEGVAQRLDTMAVHMYWRTQGLWVDEVPQDSFWAMAMLWDLPGLPMKAVD